MSRFIMFSPFFPSYHPCKGEPTYFVERMLHGLIKNDAPGYGTELLKQKIVNIKALESGIIKHHTFRAGENWKPGDKFSPRIWTGKPYRSKHYIFGPDIEVKKTWNIKLFQAGSDLHLGYPAKRTGYTNLISIDKAARNDGFDDYMDFVDWFKIPFVGQIICWNNKIEY